MKRDPYKAENPLKDIKILRCAVKLRPIENEIAWQNLNFGDRENFSAEQKLNPAIGGKNQQNRIKIRR